MVILCFELSSGLDDVLFKLFSEFDGVELFGFKLSPGLDEVLLLLLFGFELSSRFNGFFGIKLFSGMDDVVLLDFNADNTFSNLSAKISTSCFAIPTAAAAVR